MYGSQAAVVATFLHWAAAVLPVLATQMNSVLAEWAVSRCLRTLGQITVESRSGRVVFSLLLTPVLSLAASVVAEPFIRSHLSVSSARSTQRHRQAAILTVREAFISSHQPIELRVHGTYQVGEVPVAL